MINFCSQQVWSALERKQFLKAAQLYLFSHHIVSILHIDTGDTSAPKLLVGSVFFKALYNCCCGASVVSEQQHNQNLRRIYRRGYEFSNSSLFTRMHCI